MILEILLSSLFVLAVGAPIVHYLEKWGKEMDNGQKLHGGANENNKN